MSQDTQQMVTARQSRHHYFWLDFAIPTALLIIVSYLFRTYPWDLSCQNYFYNARLGWQLGDATLFKFLYQYGNIPALLLCLFSIFILIRGLSLERLFVYRKMALYLLLVMVVGPGLLVNTIFKEQWGRPRPRDLIQYGGKYAYEAPLQYDASSPGKSFPCGHASMGYYFFAAAFLLRGKSRLKGALLAFAALLYGSLIGLARMAQGGHFLSDVIWSGAIIWLVSASCYYLMKMDITPLSTPRKKRKIGLLQKVLLWMFGILLTFAVSLATPYGASKQYQLDKDAAPAIELNAIRGDVTVCFSDSSSLKSVSSGFGFPGSKIKWKRKIIDDTQAKTLLVSQKLSGFFTELENQNTLVIDSVQTKSISIHLHKSNLSVNAANISSVPDMELSTNQGNLELTLPLHAQIEISVDKNQKTRLSHPGVKLLPSGHKSRYRLRAPQGWITIGVKDK